ncbi:transketolase [Candidatus Bathyarchaeota archaeon]|nr:transketolase [Candidatus Bathyarchaeota archaeon]
MKSFHSEKLVKELSKIAWILRKDVIDMIHRAGSGHPGGSLSAAEIVTALIFHHLNIDPNNPQMPERDRFLLSKGHAAPLLYAALARRGFFPLEELKTFRQLDSRLQGHPDRLKTPGVEMTSGILGHGVAVGVGLALAARIDNAKWRVYVLVGDGEIQAGVIWEGAMMASKYRLGNLTVIVDFNKVQLDGPVNEIMPIQPLTEKWKAFGWHVTEIDGHNMREILDTLDEMDNIQDQPKVIIAHTIKGKGVSFMEGKAYWHGRAPNDEQYLQAMKELSQAIKKLELSEE